MKIVCDSIRSAEPGPSGMTRVRAVRPDGTVLIEELLSSEHPHNGYAIHTYPHEWVVGEYEWQQRIGDDWVTLSRYKVGGVS